MHLPPPPYQTLLLTLTLLTLLTPTMSTAPLTRDVIIIGGGAAGTYASIRLHQQHHSVLVIDHKPRLGGQTTTYHDPITNHPTDYGVTYFQNMSIVRSFFTHFNIPLTYAAFNYPIDMFDFNTLTPIPTTTTSASSNASNEAMTRYITQLKRYPYLKVGYDLPDPVPEDLLRPFGEFMQQYDLTAGIGDLGGSINPLGDWPRNPAVYVMKYANLDVLEGDRTGFIRPEGRDNSLLYERAERELEGVGGVMLGVRVVGVERDAEGVVVTVRKGGEDGEVVTTVKGKKLVVAIQPSLTSLAGFDLSDQEKRVFGQFHHLFFYTALMRIKGLPADVCYMNRAADDPFLLPRLPGILQLKPTEENELKVANYLSMTELSEEELKQGILHDLQSVRMRSGVNFPEPEFLAIGDHSPYELTVSAEAIQNGFYRELNALQGVRNTYYTGATWESHSTPQIWEFTEQMLQKHLLKAL
ncbi:FAD/NAD(P)-binding domain-containing protein [Aspergillus ibericus CBS 121593]|uniref:FAD/NAD(P)-binding domain-containing protein n=1 Tax=Aspergillus ibericus CBS 121593 TaxID=1448316 RepID=A0A395GLL3_9EURO|nr:FAD/NAD(P)-binding domain-containing protein [Aspergillus ibericus CBS 121593]RAK94913.1 FAD/NAD(P)-binding domain-containing protein [Aspergillus ibericus CBS 121593]